MNFASVDANSLAPLARELGVVRWQQDALGLYWLDPHWWTLLGLPAPDGGISAAQLPQYWSAPAQPLTEQLQLQVWLHGDGHPLPAHWLTVDASHGWLRLVELPQAMPSLLQLDGLTRMVGQEAVADVLADFARSLATLHTQLADAVVARDHKQLERCSHKLKSSCRLVGAKAIAEQLEALELACRQDSEQDFAALWQRLEPSLQALSRAVARQLQS